MKHLCWNSFFVGWMSLALLGHLALGTWGDVAIDLALICFFGWAMDCKARLRAEESASEPLFDD